MTVNGAVNGAAARKARELLQQERRTRIAQLAVLEHEDAGTPDEESLARRGALQGKRVEIDAALTRLTLLEADPALRLRQVLLAVPAAAGDAQLRRAAAAVGAACGCPVRTMEAPLAAAVGAGIDIGDPRPRLVLDIGAGIVETAVVIRGRVHSARSIQYVPEQRAGHPLPRLPEYVRARLAAGVRALLDDLPAPLRRTARDGGLVLTGGGARLPSLPGRLTAEIGLTITIAPDPARATIRGLAHACRSPESRRPAVFTD